MADLPLDPQYIDAIKGFEGFTPKATWDVNNHRNGYGTNARYPGEVIDQDTAHQRLYGELQSAADLVNGRFPGLTSGQQAALTSLTFNAGPKWMGEGLGNAVRSGDWDKARSLFLGYDHSAGRVNAGLTSRRAAEAQWLGDVGSVNPSSGAGLSMAPSSVAQATPPASAAGPGSAAPAGATPPPGLLAGADLSPDGQKFDAQLAGPGAGMLAPRQMQAQPMKINMALPKGLSPQVLARLQMAALRG